MISSVHFVIKNTIIDRVYKGISTKLTQQKNKISVLKLNAKRNCVISVVGTYINLENISQVHIAYNLNWNQKHLILIQVPSFTHKCATHYIKMYYVLMSYM